MKFSMSKMKDDVLKLSSKGIGIGTLNQNYSEDGLIEGVYEYCKVDMLEFPTNGYGNFKCNITFADDISRTFVFLQPYGDFDIPEKFWKKCWHKEIVNHCCAIDELGFVYIVYKFGGQLSIDAITKLDDVSDVMLGKVNHKRPYRFTFEVDDLMAFIVREFGYDNLHSNLKVIINYVS